MLQPSLDAAERLGGWVKVCTKCRLVKELTAFSKNSGQKSGLEPSCKECRSAYHAALYLSRRQEINERNKKWNKENADFVYRYSIDYRRRKPDKSRQYTKAWRLKNHSAVIAQNAARRAAKMRAMPKWADRKSIAYHYRLAAWRTKNLGMKYCVDHIVPLRHHLVCGLHVEANLRVMLSVLNNSKGNRSWPDMPGDPY